MYVYLCSLSCMPLFSFFLCIKRKRIFLYTYIDICMYASALSLVCHSSILYMHVCLFSLYICMYIDIHAYIDMHVCPFSLSLSLSPSDAWF